MFVNGTKFGVEVRVMGALLIVEHPSTGRQFEGLVTESNIHRDCVDGYHEWFLSVEYCASFIADLLCCERYVWDSPACLVFHSLDHRPPCSDAPKKVIADDHLAKLEGKIHDAKIPGLAVMLGAGSWCRFASRTGCYLREIAALQSSISEILTASRHFVIGHWRDWFEVDMVALVG